MFHLYGLFIGIAIVVGWSIAERVEPKVNKYAAWIILAGLLGARIYHAVDMWDYYSQNIWQIIKVSNGGMSIWGALVGGLIATWILYKKESTQIIAAIVTGLPLSQAIGRIGNGVNGEFTQLVWVMPWWGAEAILDLILFAIIWKKSNTQKIAIYTAGYLLIRWLLQPYR